MSKGPLALVLTGFPITLWTVWNREWKNVWNSLPWIKGALLMLALSLPWYLLAERQTPGFLHYFIVGEHFQRFTVKGWQGDLYGSGHASPLGTIWLYGLTMFLPWTLLLPLLRMKKTSPLSEKAAFPGENSFLWLWALSPLLFFTLARNILPAYVLPGIPAWCILTVQGLWQWNNRRPGIKHLIFLPASIFGIMAIFLLGHGFDQLEYRCQKQLLQAGREIPPVLLGQCPPSLLRSILLIRKSSATGTGNAASGQRNNLSGDETDGLSSAPFPPVRMEAGSGRTALAPAFPPRRPRQRKTRANSAL